MPAEPESKPGSWLVYTTVAGIVIPVLYAISWGPVGSLAANHAKLGEIADTAYVPMSWLEGNTPLSTPLGWYWNLFNSLRPQLPMYSSDPSARARELIYTVESSREIPEIWKKMGSMDPKEPGNATELDTPFGTHGGTL